MRTRVLRIALSAAVLASISGIGATSASAGETGASETTPQQRAAAVKVASQQVGDPYKRGAAGPNAFDCSGLTTYAYKSVGVNSLPRSSKAQYKASQKIAFKDAKPGDLLFTSGNGKSSDPNKISHVGIYAGNGFWYVARKAGSPVAKQRLWASVHLAARP